MEIMQNVALKSMLTFGTEVKSVRFVEVTGGNDIEELIRQGVFKGKFYLLGKGANTLFKHDYDGLVVRNMLDRWEVISEDEDSIRILAGGGVDRVEFVWWAVEQGYYGLENLVDIPGSVGAAPVQNIGAYGAEVADVIEAVQGYYLDQEEPVFVTLKKDECRFGYRDSIFKRELKNKFFIAGVVFMLKKKAPLNLSYKGIQDKLEQKGLQAGDLSPKILAEIISEIRAEKLPDYKQIGTAGSFFKNPVVDENMCLQLKEKFPELVSFPAKIEGKCKLAAGQLIEMCGLKGMRDGDAGTYEKHALVLVNYGNATGEEVRAFAQKVITVVEEKFGVILEPEVNIIG